MPWTKVPTPKASAGASVGENEGHLHVDPVSRNLAVRDDDLLVLDPGAFDILQRLGGAGYPLLDRILKTLLRRRGDFGDAGDRHGFLPGNAQLTRRSLRLRSAVLKPLPWPPDQARSAFPRAPACPSAAAC